VVSDPARDLLKLVVVERHRGTRHVGLGLVVGFGLQAGAMASSVAHDSHNLIAVGVDDRDILCALHEVKRMQGGLVVCEGGRVRGALALPIAGLMTDAPLAEVTSAFRALHASTRALGNRPERPFMALSFLALPVIPELRLTDRGLVDVAHACHIPLYVP
jgi:adenine deaminase